MIYKKIRYCNCLIFIFLIYFNLLKSQSENNFYFQSIKYSIGISGGISHYIGDLNQYFENFSPGISTSIYAKKNYNNYTSIKYQLTYANFGYSDKYAKNEWRKIRNLDFQTDIIEFAVQGDFNFFEYLPTIYNKNFTPYITLGLGIFYYNPYTYYNNKKFFLRDMKTEGEKEIPINISVPIGFGVKWSLNKYVNMGVELNYRFTFASRLDDVSSNYVNQNKGTIENALADRSIEKNYSIGINNRQRGASSDAYDSWFSLQFYTSFNFYKYYCP